MFGRNQRITVVFHLIDSECFRILVLWSFAPVSLSSENHETAEMTEGKKSHKTVEKKNWTKREIGFYRLPSNTRQSFCKLRVKLT